MRLLEVRELEGPNPYLPGPAIKIEIDVEDDGPAPDWPSRLSELLAMLGLDPVDIASPTEHRSIAAACLSAALRAVGRTIQQPIIEIAVVQGDVATHLVIAFPWQRRDVAVGIARIAVDLTLQSCGVATFTSVPIRDAIEDLRGMVNSAPSDEDAPELLVIGSGPPRVVAITGTNGKTTTTRLVAHLLMTAGRSAGWSSTSGIYIEGEEIESGDWSGPAGARHLLHRDDLDWAILETARGGILRRGLAWDQAHVTAMINVSADHLGDYGVWTTQTLAWVKGTVLRATRPDGWAVINADDPLVLGQRDGVRSRICYVTQQRPTPELEEHRAMGGTIVALSEGDILVRSGEETTVVCAIADVPLTFGGAARHMVENVLSAVGIGLGCGLTAPEIAAGLASFTSSPSHNPGRLNVYPVGSATFLADYAHNEAGLAELIHLARTLLRDDGRLWLIIGTAGDRSDETFRALGRMATEASDLVIPRDTPNYLRGRAVGETTALMQTGIVEAGGQELTHAPDEISAIDLALAGLRTGGVVALMASDRPEAVAEYLGRMSRVVSA